MPPPSLQRHPLSLHLRHSQTPSPLQGIPRFIPSPLPVLPKRRHRSAAHFADPLVATGVEKAVVGFVTSSKSKATERANFQLDKAIITVPTTTEQALQAASRIVSSGGLISVLVYIGHLGGRDELDIVESFVSSLPVDTWVSCKFEMINRPTAPVLVLLPKK